MLRAILTNLADPRKDWYNKHMVKWLLALILAFSLTPIVSAQQLGASLYFSPLEQNPKSGNNFTLTARVDSLAQPINAIKASLKFNKDKLEIISISKIGSIMNLWVEEPYYSNIEGTLSFQGGVPNPGFIGNGGIVLHIIFHAKSPGVTTISWNKGEVLANDGKGTNILTNLQNIDFEIGKDIIEKAPLLPVALTQPTETFSWSNPLVLTNMALLFVLLIIGLIALMRWILKNHDREFHEHHEEHDSYNHPHEHQDINNVHRDEDQD